MEKVLKSIFTGVGVEEEKVNTFVKEHIDKYRKYVFIHKTAEIARKNKSYNYEYWEILGDALLTKLVVWYIPKRYPQLRNQEGVKVISQLKSKIISSQSYASFALKLKFNEIIDICPELMMDMPVCLLEDVFEAFFGFTEHFWNVFFKTNQGHQICMKIISKLLDEQEYSLEFDELYDPIQRLLQIEQKYKLKIVEENDVMSLYKKSNLFLETKDGKVPIGFGRGHTISEAKKLACEVAIDCLASMNYEIEKPSFYKELEEKEKLKKKPPSNKRPRIQTKK